MSGGLRLPDTVLPRAVSARVVVLAAAELAGRRVAEALRRDGVDAVVTSVLPVDADVLVVVDDAGQLESEPLERLRETLDGVPIVVVSGSGGRRAVHDALNAGASGFVADADVEVRLAPTVRAVQAGQVVVPAEFREAVAGPLLSPREKQVLSMVVLGFANLEIANRLFLAESTVKSHLSSAYRKLGVRSRQEATALILNSSEGLGLGILSLSEDRAPRPDELVATR